MFFTEDTLTFWRGLAANNSKAWFDEHRKDYEQHLRAPYLRLADALTEQIAEVEPEYEITGKMATYRINRDVRFAKDKSPYKVDLGITVGRAQRHDATWPVYTCRVGVSGVSIAGGMYMPPTELRDLLRRYVGDHSPELRAAMATPAFAERFGSLIGDAHKRVPPALKDVADTEPLVLNKQWIYWSSDENQKLLLRPDLDQYILDGWEAARPVMDFFKLAITEVSP